MKGTKLKKYAILLIGLFIVSLCPSFADQSMALPEKVEIGLYFRASAKSTVMVKAQNGFKIKKHQGNNTVNLTDFPNISGLILRKDAYYLGNKGNYVEYTGPIQEQVSQMTLQGPYRLQLGNGFSNLSSAEAFIKDLQLTDQVYLAYEGGWQVYYGLLVSEEAALEKSSEIREMAKIETTVVYPSDTRVQVMDLNGKPIFSFDSSENIYFGPIEEKGTTSLVEIEGSQFRGEVTAKRSSSSDMAVVNRLSLEEYLYGVVPREMPASWPLEALKAQAVAARGYAITIMGKYREDGFDLCNTVSSQVYGGYDVEQSSTNRAVDETKSMILTYNGEPIPPYYHSNSGGQTEDSENVWSTVLPYIRGVKDPFSEGTPNSTWSVQLTLPELQAAMAKNNMDVGEIKNIRITEVSPNGRVLSLVVEGTKGKETLKKEASRSVFGLRSTWFQVMLQGEGTIYVKSKDQEAPGVISPHQLHVISAEGSKELKNPANIQIYNGESYKGIDSNPEAVLIEGKGYGHGLGMSQHGAKAMAEKNYNFKDILTHYYTDVKVELR